MRVFTGIQYLRGLAATAVLLFHLSERFGGELKVGSAGVDVFFVISGFIMWVTTAGKKWSPQQFMGRRFIRIVPLYSAKAPILVWA
jgi:exopolysaccharide production protein ExoZ